MDKLIIYGVGDRGKGLYDLFEEHKLSDMIFGFCDRRYETIKEYKGKRVYNYDEIKDTVDMPYLISFIEPVSRKELQDKLIENGETLIEPDDLYELFGYTDRVRFNSDVCAFLHINSMDNWFGTCENSTYVFWAPDSEFRKMFDTLDCSDIIEIACGRGRQTSQYIASAGNVTLVDILQKNIDLCKERFSDYSNITYYRNNGFNIEQLKSDAYTAVFSYDSFVHFELIEIYSYMLDIYRVLRKGGRALIHHSNNSSDYKASFANAQGGRAFMSKDIFAHIAFKCGFKIIDQKEIDWGSPKLDCLTLLEK